MYCEGSESEQAEVLVGCMLGDGTLEMRGLNARLRFIQALTQEGSVYAMLSLPQKLMFKRTALINYALVSLFIISMDLPPYCRWEKQ